MFIYGTNDFGVSRCNSDGKCRCYCETSSSSAECSGSETNVGWKRSVADCADACREKSSMFIFGTNDFGTRRCLLPCRGCKCYCETASSSGTCDEVDHDGFRLYKFGSDGAAATTAAPETPGESNGGTSWNKIGSYKCDDQHWKGHKRNLDDCKATCEGYS